MTLFVPFDGSKLSEAALVRATEFGTVFDEDVLAASVIPSGNASYARERGWITADEEFEMETAASRLRERVTTLCPSANFRYEEAGRHAPAGAIARLLRRMARDEDAPMVFVGSENAGRLVTGLSSVGKTVAADDAYDVVIVRHRSPSSLAKLRDEPPHGDQLSGFYPPHEE